MLQISHKEFIDIFWLPMSCDSDLSASPPALCCAVQYSTVGAAGSSRVQTRTQLLGREPPRRLVSEGSKTRAGVMRGLCVPGPTNSHPFVLTQCNVAQRTAAHRQRSTMQPHSLLTVNRQPPTANCQVPLDHRPHCRPALSAINQLTPG